MRTSLKSLIPKPYDFEPRALGGHIRKRRLFLNLRQSDIASLIGVTSFTVSNWENGHREPQIQHLPKLIQFLGYDPEHPNPKTLAEHLKAKRRELGWTQRIAAKSVGVDPCTWSSWECSGTNIKKEHRKLVANFLNLSETWVHTGRALYNSPHFISGS